MRNFSRYQKYSIGQDLRDGARRALRLVVRANSRRDRVPVLLELREELEELKVLLRLGHDVKGFSNFNSFEYAITRVTEIAKQNDGWLKSQSRGGGQNRLAMPSRLAGPSVHGHKLWLSDTESRLVLPIHPTRGVIRQESGALGHCAEVSVVPV